MVFVSYFLLLFISTNFLMFINYYYLYLITLEPENKKVARTGGDFPPPVPQGGQQQRSQLPSVMGFSSDGVFSEEIMVPDKIVGLSM